jgi:hypothetical protein
MNKIGECLLLVLYVLGTVSGAQKPQVREIKIPAGKSSDLWFGINVTGKLNYSICTRDGSNKLRMWWIMEPLGTVKQLGSLANTGTLKIPSALDASISAKLRASATSDTVIYIGENVSIANSVTFHWP